MTISHQQRASTHPTGADGFMSPGSAPLLSPDPEQQLDRLHGYLVAHYPGELHRTNVQHEELLAEVIIRLLMSLGTRVPPTEATRCPGEPYQPCNKPLGHLMSDGETHGIVIGR